MYVCICVRFIQHVVWDVCTMDVCRSVMSNNQFQLHRIEMDVRAVAIETNDINETNEQKKQQQRNFTRAHAHLHLHITL